MWLYLPSRCAPDMAVLNSDCLPLASISDGNTVLPLTWSGKPMRLRSLRAGWKRATWLRHLSGLTSPPSTLAFGAEWWIASLRASRASRTATPEAARASRTNAGYGPTSRELFASLVHGSWCSKTLQASFLPADSDPFCATWPRWGSLSNGECYRREAWVPATDASECSSWPTPYGFSAGDGPDGNEFSTSVRAITAAWATPNTARRGTETPEKLAARRGKVKAGCVELTTQAEYWPTPRSTDGPKGGPNRAGSKGDLMLPSFTAHWPTPASRDVKGDYSDDAITRQDGKSRMDLLPCVASRFSPPDPATSDGPKSSPNAPTSRPRLNPAFVCWLMGLPPAWTNIAHTSFGAEAMASYRSRLRQRLSCLLADSDSLNNPQMSIGEVA